MMVWIQGFLFDIGRLPIFDEIWCSLPPYPRFTPPNYPYRSITQRTSKEFCNVGQVILAVFIATLNRQSGTQRLTKTEHSSSKEAIICVRYLTDYALIYLYPIQSEANLKLIIAYLKDFHDSKYIFLRYQATKGNKRNALHMSQQMASDLASFSGTV